MKLDVLARFLKERGQVHDDLAEVLRSLKETGVIKGFVLSVVEGDRIKTTCDGTADDVVGAVRFCVQVLTDEGLAAEVSYKLASRILSGGA